MILLYITAAKEELSFWSSSIYCVERHLLLNRFGELYRQV